MPTNSLTSRTDAGALIPEEVSKEMLGKMVDDSAVLQMFRHIPCNGAQLRFPILSALPMAYWVQGDTGLKQTTEISWGNKFLNVEEIAVIMPVPDNVIEDVDADIWDEAEPLLREAVGRTLDQAVVFGVNAPSSFPTALVPAAIAAGNTVTEGAVATAGGYFGDVDGIYEKVEEDGYDVTGWIAHNSAKSKLRKARDSQGRKLDVGRTDGPIANLDGYPISYAMKGLWPTASGDARLIGGDFSEYVIGVRQDIRFKILDQAVIQDNTGAIVYNLAQQDMTAVRLTFRAGWQVSNKINNTNADGATRYPVAVLRRP